MLSRSLVSGCQSISSPASCRRTSSASSARNRIRPRSTTWSGSFSTRRERNAASIGRKITPCLGPSKPISLGTVIVLLLTLQSIPSVAPSATFRSPRVRESSGVAVSRAHRGVLWTHNDSGDDTYVYATDLAGTDRGVVRIRGARAVDWEDIALGPCPTGGGDAVSSASPLRGVPIAPFAAVGRLVPGAAIRLDGRLVAIRPYPEIYPFAPGGGGILMPRGRPVCNTPGLEPQGEAID